MTPGKRGPVTDEQIQEQIESLVSEEHTLLRGSEGRGLSPGEHRRLDEIHIELDRLWDLLRRRRAGEEFGLAAAHVRPRDPTVAENYVQ